MDDPADVARLELAQAYLCVPGFPAVQGGADVPHRLDEASARAEVDRLDEGVHLRAGGGVRGGEGLTARFGQRQQPVLAMVGADAACRQPAGAEARHDAAQVRLVHVERAADLRRGSASVRRVRQFVEDARLGQRQVGRRQAAVQEADLAGVEPIEGAHFVDQRHGGSIVLSQTTMATPGAMQAVRLN